MAEKQIPLVWVGIEDVPILFANQFVSQFQETEFLLTIGQVAPPLILEPMTDEALARMGPVPVRPIARFAITPAAFEQLVDVLQRNLEHRRQIFEGEGDS